MLLIIVVIAIVAIGAYKAFPKQRKHPMTKEEWRRS